VSPDHNTLVGGVMAVRIVAIPIEVRKPQARQKTIKFIEGGG